MDHLAAEIKQLGLTPGLWLAPHGQSNFKVVEKWGNFLLDENGKSLSDTWEGDYLVDPTHPRTPEFFRELFSTMKGWGYKYFKIDGQPIVVREYQKLHEHFHNPEKDPIEAYRDTIKTIKDTIGPDTYLLGCWGIPLEMMGIAEGSRTGGDVRLAWDPGVMAVYRTTMEHYYLHNIAWYNDTDVLLVRPPLTMSMARVWATLMGLTAQAMLTSEQFNNLSPERVDIIKRVFPAVDIRPFDLFPVRDKMKRIFDLKVNHLGRDYDVVGLINPHQFQNTDIHLKWEDIGLSSDNRMHVFDFWNREYLGCFKKGLFLSLNPASCQVLALLADQDRPQLVSTSRHITQGWVDLKALDYDAQAQSISGKSHIIADDTYTLRFAYPSGKNFRIKTVTAQDAAVEVKNHMFWSEVCLISPVTRTVSWKVTFEPAGYYHHTVRPPDRIRITDLDDNTKALTLRTTYYNHIGYYIYFDQELQGIAFSPRVILKKDQLKNINTIQVSGVWSDGRESSDRAKVEIK